MPRFVLRQNARIVVECDHSVCTTLSYSVPCPFVPHCPALPLSWYVPICGGMWWGGVVTVWEGVWLRLNSHYCRTYLAAICPICTRLRDVRFDPGMVKCGGVYGG